MAAPTLVSRVHTTPCDPGFSSGPFISGSFDVAAGNLIVVLAAQDSYTTRPIQKPTDTALNNYVPAGYVATTGTRAIQCWYCLSSAAKTGNVVTLTNTGGSLNEKGTAVMQFNASGTWSYVGGAGYTAGAYNGTATTGALNMTGAGVVAEFGTGDEDQTTSTWNFTAGCSNYYGSSSAPDDTGEGSGVVGADLLSAASPSHTFTATFALTHSLLGQWGFVVSGGSSNSLAGTSALGALGSSATASAQNAAAGSSNTGTLSASASVSGHNAATGLGNFGKLAAAGSVALAASLGGNSALGPIHTAATVTAAESATGNSRLGGIASSGSAGARAGIAGASAFGPMASAASLSATSSAAGTSVFGALISSGTIPYTHQNTLAGASTFGALSSAGTAVAAQSTAGASALGALAATGSVGQANAAAGTSAFGGLTSTGTIPFQNFNTLSGVSLLGPIGSGGAVNASQSAAGASTFAPLACRGTIPTGILSLPADPLYFIQLPARSFYAAAPARSFYVLSDPNMTTAFSNLDPRETEVLTFDASNDLANGETLTSIEKVEVTVQSGPATATPPTLTGPIINGSPVTLTVNGKTITIPTGCCVQVVGSGGVTGTQYLIAITCSTSNPDKVLTLKGILPVSAQ